MLGLRLFLGGLVLIAIVATFYATPKILSLKYNLSVHGEGSPLDTSGKGHSLLYDALQRAGYRVSLGLDDALSHSPRSIVVAVLGPTRCNADELKGVATRLARIGDTGVRAALIVTGSDCGQYMLRLLGLRYIPLPYGRPILVYDVKERAGFAAAEATLMSSLRSVGGRFEPRFVVIAPRDIVEDYMRAGRGLPVAGIEARVPGETIIVIPANKVFQNEIVLAARRAGIDNLGYALRLIGSLSGSSPNDTAVVFLPSFYKPKNMLGSIAVRIHPAMIALQLLEWLRDVEDAVLSALAANPFALLGAVLAASIFAYAFISRGIGPGTAPPEKPEEYVRRQGARLIGASETLENLLRRGAAVTKDEARAALSALYEALNDVLGLRLGTSIGKVLENPSVLRALDWRNPGDYEKSYQALLRLYIIYKRKIREKRIFPIIWSWRREVEKIILGVEPLLEALGAGLLEEKGLERVLLS